VTWIARRSRQWRTRWWAKGTARLVPRHSQRPARHHSPGRPPHLPRAARVPLRRHPESLVLKRVHKLTVAAWLRFPPAGGSVVLGDRPGLAWPGAGRAEGHWRGRTTIRRWLATGGVPSGPRQRTQSRHGSRSPSASGGGADGTTVRTDVGRGDPSSGTRSPMRSSNGVPEARRRSRCTPGAGPRRGHRPSLRLGPCMPLPNSAFAPSTIGTAGTRYGTHGLSGSCVRPRERLATDDLERGVEVGGPAAAPGSQPGRQAFGRSGSPATRALPRRPAATRLGAPWRRSSP
jgi:hypothetical protein